MADTVGRRVTRARRIAFEVLRQVEAEGAYAADVLHALLSAPVKREDAALATELTLGVLRWRRLLDFLLERQLEKPIERLDLEVLLALRLGLYQLRFLMRVPAHAAVSESVELTRWARKSSAAGLVNRVLRKAVPLAREPIEQLLPEAIADVPDSAARAVTLRQILSGRSGFDFDLSQFGQLASSASLTRYVLSRPGTRRVQPGRSPATAKRTS